MDDCYLLGLDVGAAGVKVGIFTPRGEQRGLAYLPQVAEHPRSGWAESAADGWWVAAIKGIDVAASRAGIDRRRVAAVGLSTMCPSLLALDARGEPLRPAILFLDVRSTAQAERLQRLVDVEEHWRLTGNRLAPGTTSVTSIAWIRDNEPEVYSRTAVFAHANTYLAFRLTGQFAMDWTNASFTGLFATGGARDWSPTLLSAFGVPAEKLPPTMLSSTCVGKITPEAARITGLAAGTPVAIGAADTACAALGIGVVEPGQVFETVGTSGVLSVCADVPAFDRRFLNRCHAVGDRWLLMGATSAPGASLRWYRDQFCGREQELAAATGVDAYDLMCEEASRSPAGAGRLLFLPYLSGERSPIWDPHARGVLFGLSLATTRADVTRAILEGTAFGLRQNAAVAEELLGRPLEVVRSVGGGAKSPLWSQIKADVLNRPVQAVRFGEAAVLGAAMLGGLAAGVYRDHAEAARMASPTEAITFLPRPEVRVLYDDLYAVFSSLYPQVKSSFAALARVEL